MTPQEKARELVKQYFNYVSGWTSINTPEEKPAARYEGEKMKLGRAKQCAMIAVDEIIKTYTNPDGTYWLLEDEVDYWQQVKKEIELI